MKIGIMTFWWGEDNYGQILQCYALQKYLNDNGHDACLIRYRYDNDIQTPTPFAKKVLKAFNPVKLYGYIKYRIHENRVIAEQKKNPRDFDAFRNRYIRQSETVYSSYSELKQNPPAADVYIAGSDQVWNFSLVSYSDRVIHAYMLDFGKPETKRMSYAASWGGTAPADTAIKEIAPLLKKFDYVSVREHDGLDFCRRCGFPSAEQVCDPTLLLPAEAYRNLYKENRIRRQPEKYLLLYMLGNECDFNIQSVYDFADKKGLGVVYVTGNRKIDGRRKYFATIPEWLYLIDSAEYVVTNSFHGCVFCLLFKKQFAAVPLSGEALDMNGRLESLFSLFGIKSRYLEKNDFSVLDTCYETKRTPHIPDLLEKLK